MATKAPKPPTAKPNAKAAALAAPNVIDLQPKMTNKRPAGSTIGLNFQVPTEFKREFKQFAAANDMSMVDTLKEAFELLKTKYQ